MTGQPSAADLDRFVDDLAAAGFSGEIETDIAARIVAANDNSIYQLAPSAILYPAESDDINRAVACVHRHRSAGFSLCTRGAGTGTNGQSLSDNLVLDCSRHLTRIIDFDPERQTVCVEPGVVLDQLNAFLKPHGLFFPIDISSSSRATLGGMVATDASGKGSLIYGKTSDHVESLDVVLHDGSDFHARAYDLDELVKMGPRLPENLLPIFHTLAENEKEIHRVFPNIDRGMSGYDLKNAIAEPDRFNPCYLFTGSEGTLAVSKRITLSLLKRPPHKMLTVLFYREFDKGLEHIEDLLQSGPAAIEMLDERVLSMARGDSVWQNVQGLFGDALDTEVQALNYVEHVADSEKELEVKQQAMRQILASSAAAYGIVAQRIERDPAAIANLWELRKRAVGLLGKAEDGKRGVAFVEDSAVPTKNLVSYIRGFRAVLDAHGLQYGMYGHADAGVLHVRPALNLQQARDRALIREISDAVAQLAHENGGVIWGEHGRGLRGEYTPLFFGKRLYRVLCEIKSSFDPFNLLNPGKLVNPQNELIALDQVPLRGALECDIEPELQQRYPTSIACNGNGVCFHWSATEAMCPSYRATRDKRYSPKGRAALLREWTRLRSTGASADQIAEIEEGLHDSLGKCLSCNSCTSSCPLQVNIPDMKSRFLEETRSRRKRRLRDWIAVNFSTLVDWGGKSPHLSNWLISGWSGRLIGHITGLTRLPEFSTIPYPNSFRLNQPLQSTAPLLLRDDYLDRFDRGVLRATLELFQQLGHPLSLGSLHANGKTALVRGDREVFRRHSERLVENLQNSALSRKTLISADSASRLMFDAEYPQILQRPLNLQINSIEKFLLQWLSTKPSNTQLVENRRAILLPHCMEQTADPESPRQWQKIFAQLGIELEIVKAGCCGMSGLFGHEVENVDLSDRIFALAWQPALENLDPSQSVILATGFSCRCQLKNHDWPVSHPVEYLLEKLKQAD